MPSLLIMPCLPLGTRGGGEVGASAGRIKGDLGIRKQRQRELSWGGVSYYSLPGLSFPEGRVQSHSLRRVAAHKPRACLSGPDMGEGLFRPPSSPDHS